MLSFTKEEKKQDLWKQCYEEGGCCFTVHTPYVTNSPFPDIIFFPILPFLTKGFLMVTTCVTYGFWSILFVSKGTGDSQHINLVKNGPFPNSSSFIMCPSGPPSSPLLSIFCLGRRTLSTSFKSLLRYRQILQWSPWSSRAPNTQFGLIQTVTYWLDNVYGINNEGTMEKWRLALTKKEV